MTWKYALYMQNLEAARYDMGDMVGCFAYRLYNGHYRDCIGANSEITLVVL